MTRVVVDTTAGELVVVITSARPLAEVLEYTAPDGRKFGATLASLYIDTDNDASTGGAPFANGLGVVTERRGYERQVSMQLGYLYSDDAGASGMSTGNVSVDTSKVRVTGSTANYFVYERAADQSSSQGIIDPKEAGVSSPYRNLTRIDGSTVEIRVPYAALGVAPGGTVRLSLHDTQQSSTPREDAVGDDRTLVLR